MPKGKKKLEKTYTKKSVSKLKLKNSAKKK